MHFSSACKELNVPKNASKKEIRNAYYALALKYHPDRNAGSKQAEEKFKQIVNAYEFLMQVDKPAARNDHDKQPHTDNKHDMPSSDNDDDFDRLDGIVLCWMTTFVWLCLSDLFHAAISAIWKQTPWNLPFDKWIIIGLVSAFFIIISKSIGYLIYGSSGYRAMWYKFIKQLPGTFIILSCIIVPLLIFLYLDDTFLNGFIRKNFLTKRRRY